MFVARQKSLLLRLLQINTSNICMSRVIWSLLLLYTSKVFSRLNTYNSNLTFSKARGNSHDYNTEVFLSLVDSFEIIFKDKKLHLHYSGSHRSEFQALLIVYFLLADIFCLKPVIKCFTFSLQKCKMSREFCLFTVSWHRSYPIND